MKLDEILIHCPTEIRLSSWMQALIALIQMQQEELAKAHVKIASLEAELAKFRKTPKKPKFRPNGMQPRDRTDKKKDPSSSSSDAAQTSSRTKESSEVIVAVENRPTNARFKGYQTFVVQEIDLKAQEITYKLEVWQTKEGEMLRASLPSHIQGSHFGPTLRALTTNLYAQGMTQPALHEFLRSLGIELSSGQVNNILLNEAQEYSKISEEILTAGLQEAPYIRADDTGERHQHKNSYCTHIGGEYFAYYKTTSSKSRENFLKLLLQGKEGYHINTAMIWHLFQCGVEDDVLNLLEEYKGKKYTSKKGLHQLLNKLNLTGKKVRKQCVEAALVGFVSVTILKPGQVLLSDRAGQFALFDHAACWVHMERPLRKVVVSGEQAEKELKEVRHAIWTLYRHLKEAALTQANKDVIHKLYDELVAMKSISPEISEVITTFAAYRDEMLKALDHPGLPLHNNDSERDIRPVAKRRNISGSTKSDEGRKFRDGLLSIKQTCFRIGYNFWEYLQRWFNKDPPNLAKIVTQSYQLATL